MRLCVSENNSRWFRRYPWLGCGCRWFCTNCFLHCIRCIFCIIKRPLSISDFRWFENSTVYFHPSISNFFFVFFQSGRFLLPHIFFGLIANLTGTRLARDRLDSEIARRRRVTATVSADHVPMLQALATFYITLKKRAKNEMKKAFILLLCNIC